MTVAKPLAHHVYFTLKDRSEAAIDGLIEACRTYLSAHPGCLYFGAGKLNPELARPVNDREFDVALIVVFESKAAHDAYQDHPRHLQFINENRDNWERVRVFDADLTAT